MVRDAVDEWVLTSARDKVRPPGIIPHVQTVTDPGTGRQVAMVTVEAGYAVPAMWHNKHFFYYIRAGRQSREASPEELSHLQQQCAVAFVRRNVGVRAELADGVRRVEIPGLPPEPVREALVSAVIHRDYLLTHTDVELGLYRDRDVMPDYGYLEHMGLGVPRKIVRGMQEFTGSKPEFVVGDESLTVVLRREPE